MIGAPLVDVVAKLTGETTAAVAAARQSGKSFAAIAAEHKVTVTQIVELASHAPKAALDSQVADGLLKRAEADRMLAECKTFLTREVNETGTGRGPKDGRFGPHGPPPDAQSGTSGADPSTSSGSATGTTSSGIATQ